MVKGIGIAEFNGLLTSRAVSAADAPFGACRLGIYFPFTLGCVGDSSDFFFLLAVTCRAFTLFFACIGAGGSRYLLPFAEGVTCGLDIDVSGGFLASYAVARAFTPRFTAGLNVYCPAILIFVTDSPNIVGAVVFSAGTAIFGVSVIHTSHLINVRLKVVSGGGYLLIGAVATA